MSLFAAPETLPFGIGLALIVAIALLEGKIGRAHV